MTVGSYSATGNGANASTITAASIDRTAFNEH